MNTNITSGNQREASRHDGPLSLCPGHRPVSFFCAAPRAKTVELAGDFNHWRPQPMAPSIDGWWLAQVELGHGRHQYRFLVDGQPMLDPQAMGVVRDEFDELVSLIAVS